MVGRIGEMSVSWLTFYWGHAVRKDWSIPLVTVFALLALQAPASRAESGINDFGITGIIDIPSARMPAESTLTTTYSRKDIADIYSVSYQVLPRLEAAFRYTIFNARERSPILGKPCFQGADYCDIGRDRSFEVKYRLMDESQWIPELSVGIRDLLGTGAWGSEYLVASKRVGDLDLTAGIGWGRFADRAIARNPLTYLDDRFKSRDGDSGVGGTFATRLFFRGENIGFFGGLRYRVPESNFDLVAAYNSDSYARERFFGTISDSAPLSYGLEWESNSGVTLGVSRQQGNQWGLRFSAQLDTAARAPRKPPNGFSDIDSDPVPAVDWAPGMHWWPRLAHDAESSGLLVRSYWISEDGHTLELRYSNTTYQLEADAIRRVLELARLYAPISVREFRLTGDALGLPTHQVTYRRERLDIPAVLADTRAIAIALPGESTRISESRAYRYPNGLLSVGLNARAYLFDPEFPLLYQLSARLRGDVDLGSGWAVGATWVQRLKSQFDRIDRTSDSQLPTVRTLLKDYLQQGESGIDELFLAKRGKLTPSIFFQAYGGILEEMYSGIGAEVLWRPLDRPVAVGINLNSVVQRDFDKLFGTRDYKTITGHVSVYWATPYRDFDVVAHAGRYLAKDLGATLEIQKRFANGWSIGAFATITDVPFSKFGEGSFDKGLIFNIPFDLYSPKNTRGSYRTILRPINRDGGRMLDTWPGSLWESLRKTGADRLFMNRDRMQPE
jgi:Exopolysaccharide biosynthesis protein YbjH